MSVSFYWKRDMAHNNPLSAGITLLGLGPGNPELLTRQAWQVLENSAVVYLRTRRHPVCAGFPASLQVESFDYLYDTAESFEEVYQHIIGKVLELGSRPEGVVYAVPGHPFVAEATTSEIARRAREMGIPVQVVEGLSFLEPTLTALKLDPLPRLVLIDALDIAAEHVPPYPPGTAAIIVQVYSPEVASNIKLTLTSVFPDEHPVKLVHAAGTDQELVEDLCLYEIDRSRNIGLLTSLYVPPLPASTSFEAFLEVVAHLRAPDGCPWDKEQTHLSLRPFLLEETYELLDALDREDFQAMREELGDLLLQIMLHAQIASEVGEFSMAEVIRGIHDKIVSRHPHVFGDLKLGDAQGVLLNWERLKAAERITNGKEEAGLLGSVPGALPALSQADQYQRRVSRVGFDWPDRSGIYDKVAEEIEEVRQAADREANQAEIGDLLFSVVNLARSYEVDAESALREANVRFRQRFGYIERVARNQGRTLSDLSLQEMDALWEESKSE